MLIVIIRTLVLYSMVVIIMRVMGKREIGQLQPFELVIAIMISELAAIPMENTGIPLINGIAPILTHSFNITDPKQVLIASLDTQGNLYYQKKLQKMGG